MLQPIPESTGEPSMPAPDEIERMISEAAYYLAEKRNFESGFEQEDWETAKAEVLEKLKKG